MSSYVVVTTSWRHRRTTSYDVMTTTYASKQVHTWNSVYELVHRITTARKKDRQIFTQEIFTLKYIKDIYSKTSYILTTSSYVVVTTTSYDDVVVTTSSYDVVTTTSSRRRRHVVVTTSYDDVVTTTSSRRRRHVVITTSYDDDVTTTYGSC